MTTKRHKREHRLLWDLLKLFHHCSYLSLGPDRGKDETEAVPEVKWLFETQGRDGCVIVSPSDPIPEKGADANKSTQPPLPRVLEDRILQMRAAKLPAETGGVLFGIVDLVKSRIDLVEAWPEPADSRGIETEFVRRSARHWTRSDTSANGIRTRVGRERGPAASI
jgi:hypothetical protein